LVPRRALRPHPGVEVSLAFSLDPAPYGFRFGIRAIPAVPVHVVSFKLRPFDRQPEPACASYPAYSPRASIRWARRHFLLDLLRAGHIRLATLAGLELQLAALAGLESPFTLAGFRLRSRGPYGISLKSTAGSRFYDVPVFGRFLSIPSEPSPCGFDPAVRNLLPSPRASSH
jgi:hypothetical protein